MDSSANDEANKRKRPKDEAPRGLRMVVSVWALISAICMLASGLFVIITVSAKCFIAGVFQVCVGVIVVALEAPVFCTAFDKLIKLSDFVEHYFRFWMRAVLYIGLAIFPVCMCLELSTILGSGALGVLAALYGVLTIGKKGGDIDEKKMDSASKKEEMEMKASLIKRNGEPNDFLNTY